MKLLNVILILAPLALPIHALAEEQEVLCHSGEYVITVANNAYHRQKAVEALDSVSEKPIEVEDATSKAILVDQREASGSDALEVYNERRDLCKKLQRQNREIRRTNLQEGTHTVVRNFSCSCNAELSATRTPNDPWLNQEWGLHQSSDIDINALEAWDITTGSSSAVVAVIDSGIDYSHPDLAANMWRNGGEIAGNGIDDDANGYVDDVFGINAITSSGDPWDDNGHGTHCAGTIGAVTNNGIGIAGVAWNVKLMGVKFLGSSGSGSLFAAIRAIDYVTMMKQRGVNVILSNNSWGGGSYLSPLYEAIARARDAGILFVAAAGNSASDNDVTPSYPSNYPVSNVIAVAAVDSQANLAGFSNYGVQKVHIGAPGVSIASTYPGGGYRYLSGTSMAAPHVSGALALLASHASYATAEDLKSTLLRSGRPLASLQGVVSTGTMVNARQMLLSAPLPPGTAGTVPVATTPTPTPIAVAPTPTPTPTPITRYTLQGTVLSGGVPLSGAKVTLVHGTTTITKYTTSNGAFSFPSLPLGTHYSLSTTLTGYLFNGLSGALVANTTVTVEGSVRSFTLSGKVIGRDKSELEGISVECVGCGGNRVTDAAGGFSFILPHGASYTLKASGEEYGFDASTRTGIIEGDVSRTFVAFPQ